MRIENEFEVKAPLDRVWAYLLDVEKIAPCAPGAELTEVVDDRTWKGKVTVKVGPVGLSFAGTVVLQERDDQSHTVVLKADGREQRGKGAASAIVRSRLESVDGGTKISIDTDLTISGAVAQYGRGMVGDISQRLTKEFAQCLQANITAEEPAPAEPSLGVAGPDPVTSVLAGPAPAAPPAAPGATSRPVKGFRLGVWALWRVVARFFQRLFRRGQS
jgi:carbon monoxide dehydrogenase subunit G